MKLATRLIIVAQLAAWVGYMLVVYLNPDELASLQSLESYIFICVVGVILCFLPALRLSARYEMQPFAFLLAILPIFTVAFVWIYKLQ